MSKSDLYKDPARSIEERVDDLLLQMTTQEKVAQLGSCYSAVLLGSQGPDPQKMAAHIPMGTGHITRLGGFLNLPPETVAVLGNEIQRFLREQTRLGIPAIIHDECLSGYQGAKGTSFPQMIGAAASWTPELVEQMTTLTREQMLAVGSRQGLSPNLDVARDPRFGRTEETFGEDPYLIAQMGIAYVRGLQGEDLKRGVIATGKHFVGYSQPEGGMNWAPAHIPERELYEVHATPYEAVIHEAGLGSVMNAYHEIDGVPVSVSRDVLTELLRGKMGFEGIVVSDYGAIEAAYNYHHVSTDMQGAGVQAIHAGIDIELPNTACYGELLEKAVINGLVDESTVDTAVRRVLMAKFKLGLFEHPYVEIDQISKVFSQPQNRQTARCLAQKSITLLKNEDRLLPLPKDLASIAVIGPNAASIRNLLGDYSFVAQIESIIDITRSGAEGDESVDQADSDAFMAMFKDILDSEDDDAFTRKNHPHMQSILQSIQAAVSDETRVVFAKGCDVVGNDKSMVAEAVAAAEAAAAVVLVLGDQSGLGVVGTSGEGRDRVDLTLPGIQQELLEAVCATGTPVILVLVNGRPLSLTWAAEHVPAILEAWLPGEEGGPAVADALFGDINPGGKIPISIPRSVGQVPVYYYHKPSGGRSYMTGHYIDSPAEPLYPFGFGLSYTEFEFSNLRVSSDQVDSRGQINISCDVTNAGEVAGDEVVQVYLHDSEATITRPVKQLAGFKRVTLAAAASCTVTFTVQMNQLGFYNREMAFVVEPGQIDVMVGSSSTDIHLRSEFEITGETVCIMGERSFSSEALVSPRS